MTFVERVAARLANLSIVARDEYVMQDALAERLDGFGFEREFVLTARDRLDFFNARERVAIECKVRGVVLRVAQQIDRYLADPRVGFVFLVSTVAAHEHLTGDRFRVVFVRKFP